MKSNTASDSALEGQIAAFRAFSRFYTRKLGIIEPKLLHSPWTLQEARIIYEIAQHESCAATGLVQALGLDAGFLSRSLQALQRRQIVARRPSKADRRVTELTLTAKGRAAFADMAAEQKAATSDSTLSATLDSTNSADADLLSSKDYSVWVKRDDLSLNQGFRVGTRYEEITQFVVRPGHHQEWEELVKMVIDGYKKGVPGAHWGTYEEAYGTTGGVYLVITTIKAATELDAEEAQDKQFVEAMGTDGMKKMQELEAACVESRQTNLFVIDPKMSYPPEAWVKADPDFWTAGKK